MLEGPGTGLRDIHQVGFPRHSRIDLFSDLLVLLALVMLFVGVSKQGDGVSGRRLYLRPICPPSLGEHLRHFQNNPVASCRRLLCLALLTAQMLEDEALLAELQSRRELLLYEKHFQNKVRLTERRLLVVEGEAPRLQGRQTRRPRWEVQQTTMMKKNI